MRNVTFLHVLGMYVHIVVPVCAALLMIEAQGMQQLMRNDSLMETLLP